jgi:hypothetical protein
MCIPISGASPAPEDEDHGLEAEIQKESHPRHPHDGDRRKEDVLPARLLTSSALLLALVLWAAVGYTLWFFLLR